MNAREAVHIGIWVVEFRLASAKGAAQQLDISSASLSEEK